MPPEQGVTQGTAVAEKLAVLIFGLHAPMARRVASLYPSVAFSFIIPSILGVTGSILLNMGAAAAAPDLSVIIFAANMTLVLLAYATELWPIMSQTYRPRTVCMWSFLLSPLVIAMMLLGAHLAVTTRDWRAIAAMVLFAADGVYSIFRNALLASGDLR
jgi:hypothetical protein